MRKRSNGYKQKVILTGIKSAVVAGETRAHVRRWNRGRELHSSGCAGDHRRRSPGVNGVPDKPTTASVGRARGDADATEGKGDVYAHYVHPEERSEESELNDQTWNENRQPV